MLFIIANGFFPSSLSTWTTLRVVVVSTRWNRYRPAGSVTPGSAIGALNVKYVFLSSVCACAGDATIVTAARLRPTIVRTNVELFISSSYTPSFLHMCNERLIRPQGSSCGSTDFKMNAGTCQLGCCCIVELVRVLI